MILILYIYISTHIVGDLECLLDLEFREHAHAGLERLLVVELVVVKVVVVELELMGRRDVHLLKHTHTPMDG